MNLGTERLSDAEILTILRAADEIIGEGGRTLLTKILKGSREKKILQLGLDTCPVYGSFKQEKMEDVVHKIDWMIDHDFLNIAYSGKLPMIVYTDRGWMIESDQRAVELLTEWNHILQRDMPIPDMTYLKDRNREMILLFLDKISETGNRNFIPFLNAWAKIDYKKVKAKIHMTIQTLEGAQAINQAFIQERETSIKEALKGLTPKDLSIRCMECGNYFTFTVGEQQFFKQKGFNDPKRCSECLEKRQFGDFF